MSKKILYVSIAVVLVLIIAFFVIKHFCFANPLDVDVSDINLSVNIERFDQDFLQCSKQKSYSSISDLSAKYGDFFEVYNTGIISCGSSSDLSYYDCLNVFFSDYSVLEAYKSVNENFSDCGEIERTLTGGYKHLLYYFPEETVPRVVSFVAGFNQSIALMDGFIGVGLDKYLGKDCKLYDMMQIPDFVKIEMQPSRIPFDVLAEYCKDKYPYNAENGNLLGQMIYNGMILYFLQAMYPDVDETEILNYDNSQLQYCKHYEREMWTNLIENKLLFTTDSFTIKKFVESAPFTAQFGQDCPAKAINWIGLQIVKSYVSENKVDLPNLLAETDYQNILNLSGYNPKY